MGFNFWKYLVVMGAVVAAVGCTPTVLGVHDLSVSLSGLVDNRPLAGTLAVEISFSQLVTGFESSDIVLPDGGVVQSLVLLDAVSGRFLVTIQAPANNYGALRLIVPAGAVQDSLGLANEEISVVVPASDVVPYFVGGSVLGLNGTLVLQNNGGDDLSLSENGSFHFSSLLWGGASYSISVKTQPLQQVCTVSAGTGVMGTGDVTQIQVECATNTYAVTYDGNGYTDGAAPVDGSSPHLYGAPVTVLGNTGGLSKIVHEFAGWNTAVDGSGTEYQPGDTLVVGADAVTLYAQWTMWSLNLAGTVSHFVGSVGGAGIQDGIGAAARFDNPRGIASDGTRLFVAEPVSHTIRQIVIATGETTTLAGLAGASGSVDGIGSAARFMSPSGLVVAGGKVFVADNGDATIREVDIATGAVTTVAGSSGVWGVTDDAGSAARFGQPFGITTDGTNLYVSDEYYHTIRKIVIGTYVVTTLAGAASSPGSANGTGTAAKFYMPKGMTFTGGNLFVADSYNNTIRQIEVATGVVTTLAGTAGAYGSMDGTGAGARFSSPYDLGTDGVDTLYVADAGTVVRKIVISTAVVTSLAGTSGAQGNVDGTGSAARFYGAMGIIVDGLNAFISDSSNHTIRKMVISSGDITTLAGTGVKKGSIDGTGDAARFNYPADLATYGDYLLVADSWNQVIRRVEISTGSVTTFAGTTGVPGSINGTGTAAKFSYPEGVATDGTYVFVADTGNHTIRKIVIATGEVTTLAGTANASGSNDGTGAAARFYGPKSLSVVAGNLYVTDMINSTIRKIVITTGEVTTFAGVAGVQAADDGIGAAAKLSGPAGITTDGINLFVADRGNQVIRKIVIATAEVSTLAGTKNWSGSDDGPVGVAKFGDVFAITTDGVNLFVSDRQNFSIRQVSIATGVTTTLAGGIQGAADGTGSAARFWHTSGLVTNGLRLYLVDTHNACVRVMD